MNTVAQIKAITHGGVVPIGITLGMHQAGENSMTVAALGGVAYLVMLFFVYEILGEQDLEQMRAEVMQKRELFLLVALATLIALLIASMVYPVFIERGSL